MEKNKFPTRFRDLSRFISPLFVKLSTSITIILSFLITLIALLLPWTLRNYFAFSVAKISYLVFARSNIIFNYALRVRRSLGKGNISGLTELKKTTSCGESALPSLTKGITNEVAVLFSGGTDSTLAAVTLLRSFEKVHLLTYKHSATIAVNESCINAEKLKELYGGNRVVHEIIDIDSLLREIYHKKYLQNLRRYGTFQINVCAPCKLAMYMATLAYCLREGIRFVASGSNKDSDDLLADQMGTISFLIKNFFKKHGVTYMTPVYHVDRTDWELFKLGITDKKDLKIRATKKQSSQQAFCEHGFLLSIYGKGYYVPLFGQKSLQEKSMKWFKENMEAYEKRVNDIKYSIEKETSQKSLLIKA